MARVSSSNAGTADSAASRPTKLSPAALEWLTTTRKLDPAILAKFPVGSGTTFFPGLERKSEAIFFGYPDGWKARAFPEKGFTSKPGTTRTFWNLKAVISRSKIDTVYIVEGELDALALASCEIDANSILSAPSASGNLQYVGEALAMGLNRAKKIIWCGDQDEAGLKLRDAMAHIFGAAKFYFIEWPEGTKDANDHLRSDGYQAVTDLLSDGTNPWPTKGLFRINQIPDTPPLTLWSPGFDWGKKMYLAPGTLSVVTGHPGMGKSLLWTQIWQQVVKTYELVACIASFETRPKPHMRRQLRALHGRAIELALSDQQKNEADSWINDHYLFLIHPERRPDLRWLLAEAEIAVVRHGAKILQVDPWNRLEASRDKGESETDYIGRCLREIYNFAIDLSCHVQIIAHPSKSDGWRRGDVPELEDIAGSAHWRNMVDQGFVVHRPRLFDDAGERDCYAELHHKKARFDELGYATKFGLEFDTLMGRYGTCGLHKRS